MRKSEIDLSDEECRKALDILTDAVVDESNKKVVPRVFNSRAEMAGYRVLEEMNAIGLIETERQGKQMEMKL